ncbi:hypothetical protein SCHIN_v1c05540 [Spiroplasma chinense]|uniref:MOLPALP family lipoprotein n=1 Tax=Spiroplasma chinense TaxID=216932 RepID=A0A5B9Y3Z8_9MOLU|nr:hypothetical protein [Spiroplasma chinense]QEH61751.1 hypothetical protein SCHIN_v1c05540 [Spiroplasma chinense]
MKKLISLLGSLTLTVSSTSAVMACRSGAKRTTDDDAKIVMDGVTQVMHDYSKALFLNQNEVKGVHVSPSSFLNTNLMNKSLESLDLKDLISSENLSNDTTYKTLVEKHFDVDKLTSDIDVSNNIYKGGVESVTSQIDLTISLFVNQLEGITDPTGLFSLITLMDINNLLSPGGMLAGLKEVLTKEGLKIIEDAFNNDIYLGMTMQQAIDSSSIGLSNALNLLVNKDSAIWLESGSVDNVKDNLEEAMSLIKINLNEIVNNGASISFDISKDLKVLAEIIRFVKTMVIYIDSYSFEQMTDNFLNRNDVLKNRNTLKFTIDNSYNTINIKKLTGILNIMVNDVDGKGEIVFKNLLAVLMGGTDTGLFAPNVAIAIGPKMSHDAYGFLIGNVAVGLMGGEAEMELPEGSPLAKIYLDSAVRSFITYGLASSFEKPQANWDTGAGVTAIALSALLDDPTAADVLAPYLQAVVDNGDRTKFESDWLAYIWSNNNQLLNFSIKNLLSLPLSELLSLFGGETEGKFDNVVSSIFDFFTRKSLKEIINNLNLEMNSLTNEQSTIDFNEIAKIFETIGEKIEEAIANPKDFWKILGYKGTGDYEENSAFDLLYKFLSKSKWIESIAKVVNVYMREYNMQVTQLNSAAKTLFDSLNVTKESSSNDKFVYSVTDGKITNKFEITLTGQTGNKVIKSITLL